MKERFWILHYISGGIIFILLLSHIFMMHFYKFLLRFMQGKEPLEWEAVVERARNVTLTSLYVFFLFFALFHGLYGLKNILIETNFGKKFEREITFLFLIIGFLVFAFGTFTTIKAGALK